MDASEAELDRVRHRCYHIVDRRTDQPWDNGDYAPHFGREREALDTVNALDNPWGYRVEQISYYCLIGPDCDECGGSFEDWMDGASHCTPTKSRQEIERNDWRWTPRGWLCGNCFPLWETTPDPSPKARSEATP